MKDIVKKKGLLCCKLWKNVVNLQSFCCELRPICKSEEYEKINLCSFGCGFGAHILQ